MTILQSPLYRLYAKHMFIGLLIIALDQLTKLWAIRTLFGRDLITIASIIKLKLETNYGYAFSLFSNYGQSNQWLLVLASLPLVVVLSILLHRRMHALQNAIAETLVLAGGVSNLFDRIGRGMVIDFLGLQFGKFNWPTTFNLADCSIVLGIMLLILRFIEE